MLQLLNTLRLVRNVKNLTECCQPWETLQISQVRVIDGDTLHARITNKKGQSQFEKIRLMGYDAPEMHEARGKTARLFLINIFKMSQLHLTTQWKRDPYGRLLGNLVDSNGMSIAKVFKQYNLSKC